ncbi:MAG: Ig-like domain-containing protein [Chloroflexi bacterium]|nr:Ig-like domain-containing protein [Chloroflexota bacterium]
MGQHTLTVEAVDTVGNVGSASVTVTVDNTAPTVSITEPAADATVSGTVTVSADTADGQGVTEVRFLVDGVLQGTKAAAPFSLAWDTTIAANGLHTVTIEARDAAGNVGSASVSVTVQNPPT